LPWTTKGREARLLMLDEPSQGIMPRLVDDIFAAVVRIRALALPCCWSSSAWPRLWRLPTVPMCRKPGGW